MNKIKGIKNGIVEVYAFNNNCIWLYATLYTIVASTLNKSTLTNTFIFTL